MTLPAPAPRYRSVLFHSITSYLGQSLMQAVDLAFCRDLGSAASATVGSSTSFFAWFMILGIGVFASLEYLIPHSLGRGREGRAREYFKSGIALILVLSLFSMGALLLLTRLAPLYGMNPEIVPSVRSFSAILSLSFLPTFLIPLFRIELQARGRPHDTTIAFLAGNLLNAWLNWALIYGHSGLPALGVTGSAWANVLSRFAILAFVMFRLRRLPSSRRLPDALESPPVRWKLRIKTILRTGMPISLQMLFEIGAFIFVSTLASRLGTEENTAHAVALSLASFLFMIPGGMSSAAALTMSRALGEGRPREGVVLGDRTIRIGALFAILSSITLWLLPVPLLSLFTSETRALEVGVSLLRITAIFQFGDALQVILSGCIRGFGETGVQARMNGIGHWLVGIPVGLALSFQWKLGIQGLWIGLCAGLFTVAILLGRHYLRITATHRSG
ncbi:MATE family efflux transporter [bacterium]|jgi:MATE family multidrug resistance protein|nr:MATE family efflux transporter [bacterium]